MYYKRKGDSTTEAEVGECVRGMSYLTGYDTEHLIKLHGLGVDTPSLETDSFGGSGTPAAPVYAEIVELFPQLGPIVTAEMFPPADTTDSVASEPSGGGSLFQKAAALFKSKVTPAAPAAPITPAAPAAPIAPIAPAGRKIVTEAPALLQMGTEYEKFIATPQPKTGTPWTAADSAAVGSASASTAIILSNLFKKKKKKKKKSKVDPIMYQPPPQSSLSPMLKAVMIGAAIAGAGYLIYRAKGGSTPRIFRRAAVRTRRYARRARRYARKSYIGARRSVRKYTRRRR